jgi:hypothetical protein
MKSSELYTNQIVYALMPQKMAFVKCYVTCVLQNTAALYPVKGTPIKGRRSRVRAMQIKFNDVYKTMQEAYDALQAKRQKILNKAENQETTCEKCKHYKNVVMACSHCTNSGWTDKDGYVTLKWEPKERNEPEPTMDEPEPPDDDCFDDAFLVKRRNNLK